MPSEEDLKPKVIGGKILDYKKYIPVQKEQLKYLKKLYQAGAPVFLVGKSGTHLVGWYLSDWYVGKIIHISQDKAVEWSKKHRLPRIFIIKDVGSIDELKERPRGVIVETFRDGFYFGIIRVLVES